MNTKHFACRKKGEHDCTVEETEAIRQLYAEGYSVPEIAQAVGLREGQVAGELELHTYKPSEERIAVECMKVIQRRILNGQPHEEGGFEERRKELPIKEVKWLSLKEGSPRGGVKGR